MKALNYVLAVLLLLAYLSVYFSPEIVWPVAFLGLAFPFLVAANVLFFIFWIVKKKLLFLVSLIVLLVGIKPISRTYQLNLADHKETEKIREDLTIMSYNVRVFNMLGNNEFGKKQIKLLNYLDKQNPDIICFQEFYVNNNKQLALDSLMKYLPDLRYHHIFWLSQSSEFKYGIATFSKYPIVKKGRIDLGETLNAAIFSDVLIDKERIRIYNNHLQSIRFKRKNYKFISNQNRYKDRERLKEIRDISYRLKDAFIKRSKQAEKIKASINRSSYPVLVCGDFNDTPISYTYQTISSGLNDAFVEAGSGMGVTYQGKFPSFRIDYIFYDNQFAISGFEVMRNDFSDHFPVKASLKMQQ